MNMLLLFFFIFRSFFWTLNSFSLSFFSMFKHPQVLQRFYLRSFIFLFYFFLPPLLSYFLAPPTPFVPLPPTLLTYFLLLPRLSSFFLLFYLLFFLLYFISPSSSTSIHSFPPLLLPYSFLLLFFPSSSSFAVFPSSFSSKLFPSSSSSSIFFLSSSCARTSFI